MMIVARLTAALSVCVMILAGGALSARAELANVPAFPAGADDAPNSFVADTLVLTPNGMRRIADLQVGDIVMSYNISTQGIEQNRISHVTSRTESWVYEMGVGGEKLLLTRDHPFLTTEGWFRAVETSVGDVLINMDGAELPITTCVMRRGSFEVYNIEVEFTGTFFVSNQKLLAH